MAERVQKQRSRKTDDIAQETETSPVEHPEAEELAGLSNELLDEIDELLEENAEEFVRSYIQKNGE